MAEGVNVPEDSSTNPEPPQPPPFLEVTCKSSGKIRRFAVGTNAGFAVHLINRKLEIGALVASHIEAIKEGEEPVSFGPKSVLVDYGNGWKLQSVTESEFGGGITKGGGYRMPNVKSSDGSKRVSKPVVTPMYLWKIFVAFILLFVLGGIFTLALENLPRLILFINSFM